VSPPRSLVDGGCAFRAIEFIAPSFSDGRSR
jgi:hypothetical protein